MGTINKALELDEVMLDNMGVTEVEVVVKIPEKKNDDETVRENGELITEEIEDLNTA